MLGPVPLSAGMPTSSLDAFISEVCFCNCTDLASAVEIYNAKADLFGEGLAAIKHRHASFLKSHQLGLGVETMDNIDTCVIRLRALPPLLPVDIQSEIIALFNTTWSQ